MKGRTFYEPECTYLVEAGDAVDWLREVLPDSFDLVITDPPYESLEKHRAKGTTTRLKQSKSSSNKWFSIFPNKRFHELFTELYRVLKPDSHLYVFCDQETMWHLVPAARENGFRFWKFLIWDKQKIGMGYHYRARHELICFFEKGKRKLHNLGVPDVLKFPRINGGYPTEKPWGLMQVLVEQSSEPCGLVADPFMGSASVGVAAMNTGRGFRGCDLNEGAVRAASGRLNKVLDEIGDRQKTSGH